MSFEFGSAVTQLTHKLQSIGSNSIKQDSIKEVQQQLAQLQTFLMNQLAHKQKKIQKIQRKVKKKQQSIDGLGQSAQRRWLQREKQVSETIGHLVQQYENKAEQAVFQIQRDQISFRMDLQGETQIAAKQIKSIQYRVKDQIKTLQKELSKWKGLIRSKEEASLAKISKVTQRKVKLQMELRKKRAQEVQGQAKRARMHFEERIQLIKKNYDSRIGKIQSLLDILVQAL